MKFDVTNNFEHNKVQFPKGSPGEIQNSEISKAQADELVKQGCISNVQDAPSDEESDLPMDAMPESEPSEEESGKSKKKGKK
jgi:hypothetical protein